MLTLYSRITFAATVAIASAFSASAALSQETLQPARVTIEENSCQLNVERAGGSFPATGNVVLAYSATLREGLLSSQVIASSGDKGFDAEVQARLRTCRFRVSDGTDPATRLDGLLAIPIRFTAAKEPNGRPYIRNVRTCAPSGKDYPAASVKNREQGTTKVRFFISDDDRLSRAEIAQSSGYPVLDVAAIFYLSRCQFGSATSPTGERIPSDFVVQYVWRLQ